ncbi:MAG: flagellar basal body P-ring formation protein FlgA [Nitrospinae bacterium]|nr:flagellar basal body P-ring formation protein FlgA [Nitrospinota bacterium]
MSYELRVKRQKTEDRRQKADFYFLSSVLCSLSYVLCLLYSVSISYAYDSPSPRILPIRGEIKNSNNHKATVNIIDSPSVAGEVMYLKDIAEINGEDADFVNKLKNVAIGYSPLPGESQAITDEQLKLSIKRDRIALEDIKLNSPQRINISRKYFEFTPQQLRSAIEDFVESRKDITKGRIVVDNINYSGKIILPSPDFGYEINAGSSLTSSGRKFFNIIFKTDGKFLKGLNIAADLKVVLPVAVAANHIKKGEPVSETSIQIEEREISRDLSQIVTDPRDIVGKQAKVDIAKGEVIRIGSAETMILVNQGDVVNIVAESNMLRVAVKGVVRDKGGKGELVKVLNVSSNKVINAKIIDSNTVRVEF